MGINYMMAALESVNRTLNTYVSPLAGPAKAYGIGGSVVWLSELAMKGKISRSTLPLACEVAPQVCIYDIISTVNTLVLARRAHLLNGALCYAAPMIILNGLAIAKHTFKYPLNDRVAKVAEVCWNYSTVLRIIASTGFLIYELRNKPHLAGFVLLGAALTRLIPQDKLSYIIHLESAIVFYNEDKYTKAVLATEYIFAYLLQAYPQMFTIQPSKSTTE
jgi:hypothetical protein